MRDPTTSGFGAALRRLRGMAGLTQEALAERARISVEAISALERGFRKRPHSDTVGLLAKALGLSEAQRIELKATASGDPGRLRGVGEPLSTSGNLPNQAVPLVGRDSELEAIVDALRRSPLVTLTGAGGIGKTRIALQVGANLRAVSVDGVWFVDLSSLSEGDLIPLTIASALGIQLPPDGDAIAALLSSLKARRLLLILDNCEHLVDALCAVVATLLSNCPGIGILATSQQRLGVAGEMAYRIPSLAVPAEEVAANLHADQAITFGAIALFVSRAEETGIGFALTDANAPLVAEICRRLDGIALAIELAAAQVRLMSLPELRNRLDARFQFLVSAGRSVVPRHQTLRATFDWSYELLDEDERAFFRTVGIFVDGFTLEAAQAVCLDGTSSEVQVLGLLAGLVDKSFLIADIQSEVTRYRLLETARAYALEKLSESGELDRLAARHLVYFHEYVEHAAFEFEATGNSSAFVATLAIEVENIRAALRRSLGGGDILTGAALAAAVGRHWVTFASATEGIDRLEAFLAAIPDGDAGLRARIWSGLAALFAVVYRTARSSEATERAVAYARASGDPAILFHALRSWAYHMARVGRFDEAETALHEAEVLAGPTPSALKRLYLLTTHGFVAAYRGDYVSAVRAYDAVRPLYRAAGDVQGEANATIHLAEVEHARGETARAIDLVREMLPNSERILGREIRANLFGNLAGYLVVMNDLPGALAADREVITLVASDDPTGLLVLFALENVALVLAINGEYDVAAHIFGYCIARHKNSEFELRFTEEAIRDRLTAILSQRIPKAELDVHMAEGAGFEPQRAIDVAFGSAGPVSPTAEI